MSDMDYFEYADELDRLYKKLPRRLKSTVSKIVELEIELERYSNR